MLTETVQKVIFIKSAMEFEDRKFMADEIELSKWTEKDEFRKLDERINRSNQIMITWNNFLEDWELSAIFQQSKANEKKIKDKYCFMYVFDEEDPVIRKIVDVEWKKLRGVRGQYFVVTQCIELNEEHDQVGSLSSSLEPYYINDILHEMLYRCHQMEGPHNRQYIMIRSQEV